MASARRLLPVVLAALALAGCHLLEPPPVEIGFRESLLGAGYIVQVRNLSNEPLRRLEVRLVAPSGEERRYAAARLAGYQTLEVGWKKLDGWRIPPGVSVEVRAGWRPRAARARLAATPSFD